MTDCSVKVAVRVRPMNEREKKLNATLCIEMDPTTTRIWDHDSGVEKDDDDKAKTFAFDHSLWSYDGFEEQEDGYAKAVTPQYVDQAKCFDMLGQEVLNNAWDGYHCCLFAYGQTGAGKSYSMVGYGANQGIVPISCNEIFERIGRNTDPGLKFEVSVSMLEIYNEQVQDLFIPGRLRPKKGLEIRERTDIGIYVKDLLKRPVDSYEAITKCLAEGTHNRTVGATLMNATSSRAHTVLQIEFLQVSTVGGKVGKKLSVINLVDLAGSEKNSQTGATGDRLKEGCAINKSLSALGNVISALADKASGKLRKDQIVPYRDSKLTRLLQQALGGSSKTLMICAISPASSNYEETLSTLRYADRAKKIKNVVKVNEDPQDALIRQLREENSRLQELLAKGQAPVTQVVTGGEDPAEAEARRLREEEDRLQHQAEIAQLEKALAEMNKSWEEKLKEAEDAKKKRDKEADAKGGRGAQFGDLTLPHITNLNEDPQLTGKIFHAFQEGETWFGRPEEGWQPQVALTGLGIQREQAVLVHNKVKLGKASVVSRCSLQVRPGAVASTFVNGDAMDPEQPHVLQHGDRVVFGQNLMFVFVQPLIAPAATVLQTVSYDSAAKECAEKQGTIRFKTEAEVAAEAARAEEYEAKLKAAEQAREQAAAEAAAALEAREAEFQRRLLELEQERSSAQQEAQAKQEMQSEYDDKLAQMRAELERQAAQAEAAAREKLLALERQQQQLEAQELERKQREAETALLDEQLLVVMPLVKEANLIAKELQKPYELSTKLHVHAVDTKKRRTEVCVVVSYAQQRVYTWSPGTLENRIFLMRELFELWCDAPAKVDEVEQRDDPFWDPVEVEQLIGTSRLYLESLTMKLDNEFKARVMSLEGKAVGHLECGVYPLALDGSLDIPDSELIDEPQELVGKPLAFLLKVVQAMDLPPNLAHNVRITYGFYLDPNPYEMTYPDSSPNPVFNYEKRFTIDPVTPRFIEYLTDAVITFSILGQDANAKKAEAVRDADDQRRRERAAEAQVGRAAEEAEQARIAAEAQEAERARQAAEAEEAERARQAAEAEEAERERQAAEAEEAERARQAAEAEATAEGAPAAEAASESAVLQAALVNGGPATPVPATPVGLPESPPRPATPEPELKPSEPGPCVDGPDPLNSSMNKSKTCAIL